MEDVHTYRSKFFITFIHAFLVFFVLVFIDDGLDIDYEAFLVASSAVAILTFVAIRYFKITVTDEYLRGYDCWGKYHSVDWVSITGVKPIRIAGMKYFRVENTASNRPLWIPHFLDDISGFKLEAIKIIDSDNPLNRYLEEQVK